MQRCHEIPTSCAGHPALCKVGTVVPEINAAHPGKPRGPLTSGRPDARLGKARYLGMKGIRMEWDAQESMSGLELFDDARRTDL